MNLTISFGHSQIPQRHHSLAPVYFGVRFEYGDKTCWTRHWARGVFRIEVTDRYSRSQICRRHRPGIWGVKSCPSSHSQHLHHRFRLLSSSLVESRSIPNITPLLNMSSPPSLEPLKISHSNGHPPNTARPLSPSPSPPDEKSPLPNGDEKPQPPTPTTQNIVADTPPATPAHEAQSPIAPTTTVPPPAAQPNGGPPSSLPRPQLPANTASAPVIPGVRAPGQIPRPGGPGGMGRGGMPMPMGMRGPAMGGQMQSRLPPSLQAKMDKVSPGVPLLHFCAIALYF